MTTKLPTKAQVDTGVGTDAADAAATAGAPINLRPVFYGFDLASGPEIVMEQTWRSGKVVAVRQLSPPAVEVAQRAASEASVSSKLE